MGARDDERGSTRKKASIATDRAKHEGTSEPTSGLGSKNSRCRVAWVGLGLRIGACCTHPFTGHQRTSPVSRFRCRLAAELSERQGDNPLVRAQHAPAWDPLSLGCPRTSVSAKRGASRRSSWRLSEECGGAPARVSARVIASADLVDITTARGTETRLPICVRLMGALGTGCSTSRWCTEREAPAADHRRRLGPRAPGDSMAESGAATRIDRGAWAASSPSRGDRGALCSIRPDRLGRESPPNCRRARAARPPVPDGPVA